MKSVWRPYANSDLRREPCQIENNQDLSHFTGTMRLDIDVFIIGPEYHGNEGLRILTYALTNASKNNLVLGKMVVSKRRTFPLEPSFSNASLPQRCPVCIYTADVFS